MDDVIVLVISAKVADKLAVPRVKHVDLDLLAAALLVVLPLCSAIRVECRVSIVATSSTSYSAFVLT